MDHGPGRDDDRSTRRRWAAAHRWSLAWRAVGEDVNGAARRHQATVEHHLQAVQHDVRRHQREVAQAQPTIGAQGDGQLVNYRFRPPYYVVDRLFGAAELRMGAGKAEVVRIERTDGVARRN